MSDDLRVISEGAMPDPLRGKLKALVEEWRGRDSIWDAPTLLGCAEQVAALLAESEPEPCSEWEHCPDEDKPGHFGCDVLRAACGFPRDKHPKPEPATLKLGHAYCGPEDGSDCKITMDYSPEGKCWLRCGQPREAH